MTKIGLLAIFLFSFFGSNIYFTAAINATKRIVSAGLGQSQSPLELEVEVEVASDPTVKFRFQTIQ